MPFKSEKQRKWMWANDPEMAKKWEKEENKMKEISLRDIAEAFSKFNWGYSHSSDIKEWKQGESAKRRVKEMVQTYLSKNPTHSNKIESLSNKLQERKFSTPPFNSKIWVNKNFNQISMREDMLKESGILYRAGVKKYGKEGMTKIQQAAGQKKSHAEIGAIKDKYEKDKKEGVVVEKVNTLPPFEIAKKMLKLPYWKKLMF